MKYWYSFLIFMIAVLSRLTQWHELLIFSLLIILFLRLFNKTGNGILLRESIAILYVATCLIMPYIGYEYYGIENRLSRVWVGYMAVSSEVYYNYALPAVSIFCFAITLPIRGEEDEGRAIVQLINRIRARSVDIYPVGVAIMLISAVSSVITPFLPSELQFFSNLFYYAGFAGFLYVHFAGKHKYKRIVMWLFIATIVGSALSQGMFTVVAYMGITIFSFFLIGNRMSIIKKVIIFVSALLFIIVLQNTKSAFRGYTWNSNYSGNKALLFSSLFFESFQRSGMLMEPNNFFPLYLRANQGFNVAKVMHRMPAIKPFDGGNRLTTVFASAIVPRFLWPDKPEAGGKFNMEYYAGWTIKGWSTNVGPLGEAYGSFGVLGGISYMFILGLFIRFAYASVFKLARNQALFICWIPVLFFQITYSAENDTLQIVNSLLKTSFFIYLLYKLIPAIFIRNSRSQLFKGRDRTEYVIGHS